MSKETVAPFISTLSPMRGKQRLREIAAGSVILDSYEDNHLTSVKGINTRDYNDVMRCDAVFVNFLGATKVSIGTVMEIAWAKAFLKPVVCVMDKDNIHNHSMLNYSCGYIVDTLDEGVAILQVLLGTDSQVDKLTQQI
jgi:nucleoside 2-deoxyribosyltransferase